MEQFSQILSMWFETLCWISAFAVSFAVLSRYMPCNPGMAWWKDRRAVMTDTIYWFVVPIFLQTFRIIMLMGFAALIFGSEEGSKVYNGVTTGYPPFGAWPIWVQGLVVLFVEDIMLYWIHRIFHSRHMWRYHAVHHSPKQLDWMSTQRFHPVNNLLEFGIADVIMLLAGFSIEAFVFLASFNIIFSALVHSNLNWTWGPFRHWLASPVFHRWHHTGVDAGGSSNFAPTFPIIDVVFGTFYMPKGKLPEVYGVDDPDFPEDFWGQFMYPFRKIKK